MSLKCLWGDSWSWAPSLKLVLRPWIFKITFKNIAAETNHTTSHSSQGYDQTKNTEPFDSKPGEPQKVCELKVHFIKVNANIYTTCWWYWAIHIKFNWFNFQLQYKLSWKIVPVLRRLVYHYTGNLTDNTTFILHDCITIYMQLSNYSYWNHPR